MPSFASDGKGSYGIAFQLLGVSSSWPDFDVACYLGKWQLELALRKQAVFDVRRHLCKANASWYKNVIGQYVLLGDCFRGPAK